MVFTQYTDTMDFLRRVLRGRDPTYYEENSESVELWSPGNPFFETPEGWPEAGRPRRRDAEEAAGALTSPTGRPGASR